MPRLSIIIPLLGKPDSPFEETLAAVLQNRPSGCEVLVVHAGPYADPYHLADEVCLVEHRPDATLVDLLNAGVEIASSPVLHVLRPGVIVDEGWCDSVLPHFEKNDVASVSPLVLDSTQAERIVSRGVNYGVGGSRRVSGCGLELRERTIARVRIVGPTLTAAFYRRVAVQAVSGFATSVGDRLADIDLALSLKTVGYRSLFEPNCRVEMKPEASEDSANSFTGGRQAERLFRRHATYRGKLVSLLVHPFTVALSAIGDLPHPGALTQLLGRFTAWFGTAEVRNHQAVLADVKQRLAEEAATISFEQAARSKQQKTPLRKAA